MTSNIYATQSSLQSAYICRFLKNPICKIKVYSITLNCKNNSQPASLVHGFPIDFKFVIFARIFYPPWVGYKGTEEEILSSCSLTSGKTMLINVSPITFIVQNQCITCLNYKAWCWCQHRETWNISSKRNKIYSPTSSFHRRGTWGPTRVIVTQ